MKTLIPMLMLAAGCSAPATCPEPFYDGKASDEAWRSMQDGESRAKTDAMKVIALSTPSEGMKFPATDAPKFVWTTPLTAATARPLGPDRWAQLTDLIYSSAWAHLPPVTGAVHWFRISVPKQTCGIELVTTRNEWTPSTEAWAKLKDTKGATLSMDVFSAYLQDNRISEGPYHFATPVTFAVGP